jgi:hypothetical protein
MERLVAAIENKETKIDVHHKRLIARTDSHHK